MKIKRGDVLLVNLDPVIGSEQGRTRPVLVIQNDFGNEHSPIIIVAPLTSKIFDKEFPTNVIVLSGESELKMDSTVLLNQIRSIDKLRVSRKLGALDSHTMSKVDGALKISLGLE